MMDGRDGRRDRERERGLGANEMQACVDAWTDGRAVGEEPRFYQKCRCALMDWADGD